MPFDALVDRIDKIVLVVVASLQIPRKLGEKNEGITAQRVDHVVLGYLCK